MGDTYIFSPMVLAQLQENASDTFPKYAGKGDLHMNLKGDIFEYLEGDGWTPIQNTQASYPEGSGLQQQDVQETFDIDYEEVKTKEIPEGFVGGNGDWGNITNNDGEDSEGKLP